jgi:hypothetical protein
MIRKAKGLDGKGEFFVDQFIWSKGCKDKN